MEGGAGSGESLDLGREAGTEDSEFRNKLEGKKIVYPLTQQFLGISPKDIIKDVCEDLFTKMLTVQNSKRVETFDKLL